MKLSRAITTILIVAHLCGSPPDAARRVRTDADPRGRALEGDGGARTVLEDAWISRRRGIVEFRKFGQGGQEQVRE